jgi:hypothetical protein
MKKGGKKESAREAISHLYALFDIVSHLFLRFLTPDRVNIHFLGLNNP